jgi:ABC-type antimicrobial peptide transport system permease subunit
MPQDVERNVVLTVKTDGEPESLASGIRQELRAIDPELPLYSVMSMAARMDETLADRRTPMALALVFAGVALFLASVGIYGVLSYQVSQRSREIGIRLALGSDASGIFRLILAEGLMLLAAGFTVGVAGAFAIRRTIQSQLYGIGAMDPLVLGTVAVLLAAVAVFACSVPARRAARIDPSAALNV